MFKQHSMLHSLVLMAMRSLLLVIKFLLTLFITHYLNFEALGFFGLLSAAGVMAPSILGFGIMYGVIRHAVTKTMSEITQEIMFYGKFISVLYAVLLVICCVYGIIYDQLVLITLSIFIVFFEHINSEFYGLFLNMSRPFFANFVNFIRAALWALFYMVGAYFYPEWQNINMLLIFWLVGSVISVLCYGMQFYFIQTIDSSDKYTISFYKHLVALIKESKIGYAYNFFTTLSQYADRYIITAVLGLELAGVYIFFWQIYSALSNLLLTGVIQIYRPKLVRAFKEKDIAYGDLFKACLKKSVILSSIFAVTMIVLLSIFIPYFHKPLIEAHFMLTYWIFTGFIVSIIIEVMNLMLYSSHNDSVALKIKMISFLNIIIFNGVFTHFYGLNGAGIAFLGAMIIQFGLIHFYLKKYQLYSL